MADRLTKKAPKDDVGQLVYDKIPRETMITEGKEIEMTKWQEQWTSSTKGAFSKLFFAYGNKRMIYGYGNGSQSNQIVPQ